MEGGRAEPFGGSGNAARRVPVFSGGHSVPQLTFYFLESGWSVVVLLVLSHTGCTNAPLPSVSHTAKRTHCLPVASHGIENLFEPNAPISYARMICRSILLTSPQF